MKGKLGFFLEKKKQRIRERKEKHRKDRKTTSERERQLRPP
jgi:hypothetical protein